MCDDRKSWWVENVGNAAQTLSALSAVIFGVSTAVISYSLTGLQKSAAQDAARARDNDALVRFADRLLSDPDRYIRSADCLDVAVWYFTKDKDRQLQAVLRDRDGYERIYSKAISEPVLEQKRARCVANQPGGIFPAFYYSLNLLEMGLINYEKEISPARKKIYHNQLSPFACRPSTRVNIIFKSQDRQIRENIHFGFPKLALFVDECSDNEKEFPTR